MLAVPICSFVVPVMCNSSRISVKMSKASTELSEPSKESNENCRIVKGHWQNCQSCCEIVEVSSQIMCTARTVCSMIIQTGKRANNLQEVKNYSVPQERKKHSTKVVQYFCLNICTEFPWNSSVVLKLFVSCAIHFNAKSVLHTYVL